MLDVDPLASDVRPGRGGGADGLRPLCPPHSNLPQTDLHPSVSPHHLPPLPDLVHNAPCLRSSLFPELLSFAE